MLSHYADMRQGGNFLITAMGEEKPENLEE